MSDYKDMQRVADFLSYEKEDPKTAVKSQFNLWIVEKIAEIEKRLDALSAPSTEEKPSEGDVSEPEAGATEGQDPVVSA